MERITDPRQVAVQLNISVPFEFREHLHQIARDRRISVTQLCRDALMTVHPIHRGVSLGDHPDPTESQVPS